MKKYIKMNYAVLLGGIIGAMAGYIYWHQIGCVSGTCAITANPFNSTLYGAVMGALFISLFKSKKQIIK